jgi:hypothetical protein
MGASGVWVAYTADWSDFSIHSAELAALRWAIGRPDNGVVFWPFGTSLEEVKASIAGSVPS